MQEIASGIALIPTLVSNAYLVGDGASWVLVDACTPGRERLIRRAADRRFGAGSRPSAILLTHGHFDHAGSAAPLADLWRAPIYAHPHEIPYVTGAAEYPPFDYSSPGFLTSIARFFPTRTSTSELAYAHSIRANPSRDFPIGRWLKPLATRQGTCPFTAVATPRSWPATR
jgi:glyoxylase-like metal-dependent hydrolase (beta-lactamase superfamily II)